MAVITPIVVDIACIASHLPAKVNKAWDVTNFPFDRQTLKIVLEDANLPVEDAEFVPDVKNSRLDPDLTIDGWDIIGFKIISGESQNVTNFGDPAAPGVTKYSNVTVLIDIQRQGFRLFVNLFIGMFISGFLCSMMYCLAVSEMETRIGLMLASIFAMIGNKYILDNTLPPTYHITLSDKLQAITFVMIVLAVVSTVTTKALSGYNYPRIARLLNNVVGITSTVAYLYLSIAFVMASSN